MRPFASERLDERLGAHLADHLAALLGDVGTGPGLSGRSIVAGAGAGLRRLRSGGRGREIDLADRPVSRVDGERDAVLLAGFAAPDPGRALREPGSAVFVDLNDFPVLRNVGFEPGELRAEKGVDVGRVAAVLVGRGEEVFGPDDAEGGLLFLAELRVAGEHLALGEGIGDRVPGGRLALLRLLLRPDGGLFGERRGGDRAEVSLLGHVAAAHVLEHRGMDGAKEPELADLSERHGEGCRDRFLRPALRGEIFDGPPEIDGRHRRAHDVFGDGAHIVERIGRFDEDRHLLELVGDGALDAAAAGDDGEGPVLLFGEERRLNESDRIAVGFEGRVGQAIGGDLPRVSLVGVNQGLGIDDAQFDCLFHCLCSWFFLVRQASPKPRTPGARARGRGKGGATRRDSVRTSEAAGRTHPLRRARGRARWPFSFLISDSCPAQPSCFAAAHGRISRTGPGSQRVAGASATGS